MKNSFVFPLLLISCYLIPISCQKTNNVDFLENEQLSIDSAQKWFKKTLGTSNSRIADKENYRYLDWVEADYYGVVLK